MTTVNYYPLQSRLDFIGSDGMPVGGIMGGKAHIKAIELAMENDTVIAVCLDCKMNQETIINK